MNPTGVTEVARMWVYPKKPPPALTATLKARSPRVAAHLADI